MSRRRTERKNVQVLGVLGQLSVRAFGGTDQLDAGALRVNSSVKTISMALDDSVPERIKTTGEFYKTDSTKCRTLHEAIVTAFEIVRKSYHILISQNCVSM